MAKGGRIGGVGHTNEEGERGEKDRGWRAGGYR